MRNELITPEYGPLHGMRVMLSGSALAGPWTARMMGDYGAEIIKIETPKVGDTSRSGPRHPSGIVPKWDSIDRNTMSLELNLTFEKYPDAKEVFVDLCKQCDVWVNNIPGISKHGATDELALEANPKLIICHTTGFGMPENGGDPAYLGRPCLDTVGQAFSGLAAMNGMPDGPYITANPIMNDVIAATMGVVGIMIAYYNMLKTGKGQVIDNSMYETAAYFQNYYWAIQLNGGGQYQRGGALSPTYFPFGNYQAGDGEWVAVGVFGANLWKKFVALMGKTVEEYSFDDTGVVGANPEKAAEMDKIWKAWLAEHSAAEVEKIFSENKIPCSQIIKAETAYKHPHWVARKNFITMKDHTNGTEIIDFGAAPHFNGTPIDYSKYQAAPILGEHTDVILSKVLGYSEEKIEALKQAEVVAASLVTK